MALTKAEICDRILRGGPPLSGMFNCHVAGLNSLILDQRPDGTLSRIFISGQGCSLGQLHGPDGNFTLGPHNHNKTLAFTPLAGTVYHVRLDPDLSNGFCVDLYRYPFLQSALLTGSFELGPARRMRAQLLTYPMGGGLLQEQTTMLPTEFHTVLATPGSIWHIEELVLHPDAKQYVWATNPRLRLDPEGLYQPMPESSLQWWWQTVKLAAMGVL